MKMPACTPGRELLFLGEWRVCEDKPACMPGRDLPWQMSTYHEDSSQ